MSQSSILPDANISETELTTAAKLGKLSRLQINETTQGFYVLAKLSGRPSTTHYLATRRVPEKPRMFRDLKRLNELLRSIYPNGTIELTCEQAYTIKPAKQKTIRKKTKAHR